MGWRRDAKVWAVTCACAAVLGVAIGLGFVGVTRHNAAASALSTLPTPVEPRTSQAAASSAPPAAYPRTPLARAAGSNGAVAARSTGARPAQPKPGAAKHAHPTAKDAAANGPDGKPGDEPAEPKRAKKAKK